MALPPVNGHEMIYKKYSPNLFKWYLLGMSFRGELFCAKRLVQCLDNHRGVRTMKGNRLKVEIAQLELSDLGREDHAKA
jgi:hypothetical protein